MSTRKAAAAAADVAAAAAAAAAMAPAAPQQFVIPGGAPDAATQALQALAAMLAQQHLDAQAMRAEAAAGRAAQEASAQQALAQQCRAAAGPAPLFHGKANDIDALRWLISMERWFGSARIDASDDEARLAIAAASMRDSAQEPKQPTGARPPLFLGRCSRQRSRDIFCLWIRIAGRTSSASA